MQMTGFVALMLSAPVLRNAIKVSLVVGTCLNLINQGTTIYRGDAPEWGKLALNYAVPFLVSSYSAARARSQ